MRRGSRQCFQSAFNRSMCALNLEIFTRKPQKTSYELIAAVVTRKDVYGGSADLQRHMIFTSGLGANRLQEQRREEEILKNNVVQLIFTAYVKKIIVRFICVNNLCYLLFVKVSKYKVSK